MIHPHLDPLPSRERKIREGVYHREKKGPGSLIRALSAVID
jgi:hypothetical protein